MKLFSPKKKAKCSFSLIISFFFLICSGNLFSQDALSYSSNNEMYHLHETMQILCDSTGLISEHEILNHPNFQPYSRKKIDLNAKGYWIRFSINNELNSPQDLHINTAYFDTVEVFKYTNDQHLTFMDKSGFLVPRKQTALTLYSANLVSLKLQAAEKSTFYIRLYSRSRIAQLFSGASFSLGFDVMSTQHVQQTFISTKNFIYLFAGASLALFFLNFFLAIKGRDPTYNYLVIYNILVSFILLNSFGFSAQSGISDNYEFIRMSHFNIPVIVVSTYGFFAIHFLQLKIHYPKLFKIISITLLLQLMAIPTFLMGHLIFALFISGVCILFIGSLLFFIIIKLLKLGNKHIWPFALGSFLNIMFSIYYIPSVFIEVTDYYQREFLLMTSIFVELIIFTLVTVNRFNSFRKKADSLKIREELLLVQKEEMKLELEYKKQEVLSKITAQKSTYQEHKYILELLLEAESGSSKDLHRAKEKMKTLVRNKSNKFDFLKHFEGVHTGFISRLQEKFPALSSNEIKLCAYLKMNLSSYDIAQLQGVEKNSINQARFRLRKKLGIDKSVDLVYFISNI